MSTPSRSNTRSVLSVQSATGLLPLTVVTATSSRSGWSAASISAIASSVPVSTSRISFRGAATPDSAALDVRVGEARPPPLDPVEQLLVDALVERRLFVLGQPALPRRIRARRGVVGSVQLPLFEAVVVRQLGSPERVLEVGQRVRRAEE